MFSLCLEAGQDLDQAYKDRLVSFGFRDVEADETVAEASAAYDWQCAGGTNT